LGMQHAWVKRNEYKILVRKLQEKRQRGRPRLRREDNIKMELKIDNVGGCGLDISGSGREPASVSCEHGNEHLGFIKGGEFLD